MNILFTICGRAGSKGLKNKNLKTMLGKPLVFYTLSAIDLFIKENKGKDTIHVCASSDSKELLECITSQTKISVFTIDRSAELSGDTVGKIAVIRDACIRTNEYYGVNHDVVIDLDITSPLRRVGDIINAYEKLISNSEFDLVFSVTGARRNPYFNQVKKNRDSDVYEVVVNAGFTTRQAAPEIYDMNASIYAYDGEYLINSTSDKLFDGRCSAVVMKDTAVLDIDSEEDFELMEWLARYFVEKDVDFRMVNDNIVKIGEW